MVEHFPVSHKMCTTLGIQNANISRLKVPLTNEVDGFWEPTSNVGCAVVVDADVSVLEVVARGRRVHARDAEKSVDAQRPQTRLSRSV